MVPDGGVAGGASEARSAVAAGGPPPPYPRRFIDQARRTHRMSCYGLVYKRGCAVLRRGRIEVTVHLAEDGRVTKVEPLSNTIRVDPKLVMRCVVQELARWRFTPPRGVAPRFSMDFVFSDKC